MSGAPDRRRRFFILGPRLFNSIEKKTFFGSAHSRIALFGGAFCAFFLLLQTATHAADVFDVINLLISEKNYDQAREVAATVPGREKNHDADKRLTDAMILRATGKLQDAETEIRDLLMEDDSFERAHYELATVLTLKENYSGALNQLEILYERAESDDKKAYYQGAMTEVRQIRPWSVDGYVGLAPSTNINSAIANGQANVGGYQFSTTAQKSGIGLAAGVSGSVHHAVDQANDLETGAGLDTRKYIDNKYDSLRGSIYAGYTHSVEFVRINSRLQVDRQWTGWMPDNWSFGPRVEVSFEPSVRSSMLVGVSLRRQIYDDQYGYSRTYLNGYNEMLYGQYKVLLNPDWTLSVGMGVGYNSAQGGARNSYSILNPSVSLAWHFMKGYSADVGFGLSTNLYQGNFPLTDVHRHDDTYSYTVGLNMERLAYLGYYPRFEYNHIFHYSNIQLYRYSSDSLGLYVKKQL